MIIVVAQRVPYPPNKGEKLRTYHHIKYLVECGHAVKVLSLQHERNDQALAFELGRKLKIKVALFSLPNKLVRYALAFITGQPISVGAFYSRGLKKALKDDIKRNPQATIMLCASSLAPYVLNSAIGDTSKNNMIMDLMDVDSDKWKQYAAQAKGPMKWLYQRESAGIRKIEQQINQEFQHTFLIAEAEIALFRREVSDAKPVTKLANGMDFNAFYPPPSLEREGPPVFLFTGVMDYKPNVDAVLWFMNNCWRAIKAVQPEAKFVIAGMNPTSEIRELDKQDDIDVTGFVDEILPYYHRAWAFVAPFRLARGVQNKVLQAAACNIPVITTSMGAEGISFANEDTMFICDNNDAFSQACIQAISDVPSGQKKAALAYAAITQSYSWENQLTPLSQAINK